MPENTIVVGIDGGPGGRDAMALASVLAGATGAEVVIAHVYSLKEVGRIAARMVKEIVGDAAEALVAREAVYGPVGARQVAVPGVFAAPPLSRLAETEHAGLLIVGASHRGPIGRTFLGDVGREVVQGSQCPVAIAPKGYASTEHDLDVIGVGLDGSPQSVLALAEANRLAKGAGAQVRVVVVAATGLPAQLNYPSSYSVDAEPYAERERRIADALLETYVVPLGDRAHGEVKLGDARPALVELSKASDLLALGSSNRGAVGRMLLGSTSDALVRSAKCPVMVFPDVVERKAGRGDKAPAETEQSSIAVAGSEGR